MNCCRNGSKTDAFMLFPQNGYFFDISSLPGQMYIDRSRDIAYSEALRTAVLAEGCNHNFFNTEWTPGLSSADSWDDSNSGIDPVCGLYSDIRLSPIEQQAVGAAYTMALVRMAVYQDESMLSLLDGSYVKPTSIGRAEVATHAVGGASNRLLFYPEDQVMVQEVNGMHANRCTAPHGDRCELDVIFTPTFPPCYQSDNSDAVTGPHWQCYEFLPSNKAFFLKWQSQKGATAIFTVPSDQRDFSALDYLNVRVANDPLLAHGSSLSLMIQDNLGRIATLTPSLSTIEGFRGPIRNPKAYARALQGSLASIPVNTVDLQNILYIFLVAESNSGKVWIIDISASQAQVRKPVNLDLPVVSFSQSEIQLPEGNGPQTGQVQIIANKPLSSPGALWWFDGYMGFQVNMTTGSQSVNVLLPVVWEGDDIPNTNLQLEFFLSMGALKGVVTGNYLASVEIVEDDPLPPISVLKHITAVEGTSLIWNFRIQNNITVPIDLSCWVVPPIIGKELTSHDVMEEWLQSSIGITRPSEKIPLSRLNAFTIISFPVGVTSANLTIPINVDYQAESTERMIIWECPMERWSQRMTLVGFVPPHSA
jgi:hypothetical protein